MPTGLFPDHLFLKSGTRAAERRYEEMTGKERPFPVATGLCLPARRAARRVLVVRAGAVGVGAEGTGPYEGQAVCVPALLIASLCARED